MIMARQIMMMRRISLGNVARSHMGHKENRVRLSIPMSVAPKIGLIRPLHAKLCTLSIHNAEWHLSGDTWFGL